MNSQKADLLQPARLVAAAPGETVTYHDDSGAEHTEIPAQVPGYAIVCEVGRGAMGVVYEARQTAVANRPVAFKLIPPNILTSGGSVGRLRAEIAAAARLQHPHIVPVYDVGTCAEGTYLAMELVRGGNLGDALGGNNLLPTETVVCIMHAVAEAIEHAHQHGVIHRDIKPANVLLTEAGVPKVADFGLAKVHGDTSQLTAAGDILGTPNYMSPEQARGDTVGPQTDIYALGATLYALLTGRPPFTGHSAIDTLQQVLLAEPLSVRKLNPRVSKDLETICLTCLQKDPRRRYQTAQALAEDLRRFQEGKPIHARPVRTPERVFRWSRREPIKALLAAAVVAAIVVGSTGVLWQWRAAVVARADAVENATAETAARRNAEKALYASSIAFVDRALQANSTREALDTLESCQKGLRGWEWYYLRHLANSATAVLRGHEGPIWGVAWSPDGTRLASAANGSPTVRVWNVQTGACDQELVVPRGAARSLAFTTDGTELVTAGDDGKVSVWDLPTASCRVTYAVEAPTLLSAVALSPDGQWLAAGGSAGRIEIWDRRRGERVRSLTHGMYVLALAINPTGTLLASGGNDATVRLWDVATGQEVRVLEGAEGIVRSVTFSADGVLLVSGSDDATVRLWDVATGQEVRVLRGHEGLVTSVAFHPTEAWVISGGEDQTVRVWDARTGSLRAVRRGHVNGVTAVAVSPDGRHMISGACDSTVRVWEVAANAEACLLTGHAGVTTSVAFNSAGTLLASSGDDATVRLWDVEGRRQRALLAGHTAMTTSVAFSPDDALLASGSDDQTIRLWDVVSGMEVKTLRGHGGIVRAVTFSPDGKMLASGSDDATVRLWDVATGQEVRVLRGHEGLVTSVAFHPTEAWVISGGEDQTVRVWDARTGSLRAVRQCGSSAVWCLTVTPDGADIVLGAADGAIHLVRADTLAEVHMSPAHSSRVTSVACSPTGTRFVTAGADHRIIVWDRATGRKLLALRGHASDVLGVAVSPDDIHLASVGRDGTLRLWEGP